nr:MAG TPA: helix-turn-helix domain protein [Caudoviricetes sp.]
MNITIENFENSFQSIIKEQFKESFKELLEHETIEKRWLSIESAANYSDCSTNTIRKWLKMGLNLYKIDGTKRIDKNELDEFIQTNLVI